MGKLRNQDSSLLMLLLAVGAFVCIWSGDVQQTERSSRVAESRGLSKVSLVRSEPQQNPEPLQNRSMSRHDLLACLPETARYPTADDSQWTSDALHRKVASTLGMKEWQLPSLTTGLNVPEVSVQPSSDLLYSNEAGPVAEFTYQFLLEVRADLQTTAVSCGRVFGSVRENVKTAAADTAGMWSILTSEAFHQWRSQFSRAVRTAEKPEDFPAPVFSIQNADRFRCRRFY